VRTRVRVGHAVRSISSSLYVAKERLGHSVVPAHPRASHRLLHAVRRAQGAELGGGILTAVVEWKITPATWPPRAATAMRIASQTSDARM